MAVTVINRQKLVNFIALIGGFLASYFAQLWMFVLAFVLIFLFIRSGKPPEGGHSHPAREEAQFKRQQETTIVGFLFLLGAVLAFILNYSLVRWG